MKHTTWEEAWADRILRLYIEWYLSESEILLNKESKLKELPIEEQCKHIFDVSYPKWIDNFIKKKYSIINWLNWRITKGGTMEEKNADSSLQEMFQNFGKRFVTHIRADMLRIELKHLLDDSLDDIPEDERDIIKAAHYNMKDFVDNFDPFKERK